MQHYCEQQESCGMCRNHGCLGCILARHADLKANFIYTYGITASFGWRGGRSDKKRREQAEDAISAVRATEQQ
jgi:hypothetical protein